MLLARQRFASDAVVQHRIALGAILIDEALRIARQIAGPSTRHTSM
jgi:hypothetical protein